MIRSMCRTWIGPGRIEGEAWRLLRQHPIETGPEGLQLLCLHQFFQPNPDFRRLVEADKISPYGNGYPDWADHVQHSGPIPDNDDESHLGGRAIMGISRRLSCLGAMTDH